MKFIHLFYIKKAGSSAPKVSPRASKVDRSAPKASPCASKVGGSVSKASHRAPKVSSSALKGTCIAFQNRIAVKFAVIGKQKTVLMSTVNESPADIRTEAS